MCRLCGREACAECFAKVRELTQYRPGASDSEIAALQAKRESHAHKDPFLLLCARRNEHQFSDFSPMSRFDKAELDDVIGSMEKLVQEEGVQRVDSFSMKFPTQGTPRKASDNRPSTHPGASR